jgi:hypothetical protein
MKPGAFRTRGGLALLALALAAGCGPREDAPGASAEPAAIVHVRVAAVEERIIPSQVTAPGQWRAVNELAVSAPFAAVVESLRPHAGDRVTAGQAIGSLITRESRAAVRGAELMLRQAQDPAARAEATRALEIARHDLVRVPLVAGGSGLVIRRGAEPGAEVPEGGELLAIVPERDLVFEAHVAPAEAGRITPGRPASIAMEGLAPVAATVQRRLPGAGAADQTALILLAPRGRAPEGALDRFGTATIETGRPRRALAVPDSALVEDDLTGEFRVARVDSSGVALWTVVRLGAAAGGWHELLAPALPAGTALVTSGQRGLPDSTRVTSRP